MAKRRATMRDVAAASGVSPATVSFVLNAGSGQKISPETRERVERAAAELGYVPHGIAKALREGASRCVLLSLPPVFRGPSSDSFVRGLDDELGRHGHVLLVHHGSSSRTALSAVVAAVSPRAVIDLTDAYRADGGLDSPDEGGWVDGLAAHTTVQLRYLAERGHSAVAIAGPHDPVWAQVAHARLRYAHEVAGSLGLEPVRELAVPPGMPATAEAVRAFRHAHPGVSALAVFNDRVALRLLAALHELGVGVPAELAVIGFDDDGYGEFSTPPLTSVRIDAESYGRRAARRALGLDDADVAPSMSRVVVRGSV